MQIEGSYGVGSLGEETSGPVPSRFTKDLTRVMNSRENNKVEPSTHLMGLRIVLVFEFDGQHIVRLSVQWYEHTCCNRLKSFACVLQQGTRFVNGVFS